MGLVATPNIFVPGTSADATQVNADIAAIVFELNGNINADNALTTDGPVSVGRRLLTGSSQSLALADHEHTVNGMEPLAADPSTGNFVGREYFNTVDLEVRLCIDATGSGTWVTAGNPTATELVVHAAQHKDGGHDPLADNTITDHMLAAKTNLWSATLGSNVNGISSGGFTDIIDLAVTTTGQQTLAIMMNLRFLNTDAATDRNAGYRLRDVTNSNATIWMSEIIQINHNNQQQSLNGVFYYTVPAAGARTLRIQAGVSAGSTVNVLAPSGFNSETVKGPTIQAVVV